MTRKKYLVTKLILLILVLLALSGIALRYTMKESFGAINIVNSPNAEIKEYTEVNALEVKLLSVPIKIIKSDVTKVRVKDNTKAAGFTDTHPIIIKQEGDVLSIDQRKSRPFLSFIRGSIVVEVPKETNLKYTIKNISGSIDHDAPSSGTLTATSISGSVIIHHGGEKAYLKSTSGSVRVYESFRDLSASSVSGSVNVTGDENSQSINASSVSGSLGIKLKRIAGYSMNYSTTSGSVKDTYENVKYSKSGNATFGDGSLNIDASTVSGSIRLADW